MRQIKKAGCVLLSTLFLLLSLAACGSEPPPESAVESTASASSAASVSSGAGRYPANTPEAAPLADDGAAETELSAPALLTVRTRLETPVLHDRGRGGAAKMLSAGETLEVADEGNVLWYALTLEDGSTGYVYAEDLYRVSADGGVSETSLAQEEIQKRLDRLREQFPDGKYWNHMGQELPFGQETPFIVTDEPCEHEIYGESYCNIYNGKTLDLFPQYGYLCQCLGFASLMSDQIFGEDTPLYFFYDYDQLRIGDQIRLDEYEHSMIVVEKTEESVTVAEVNADYEDCLISWTREISRYELEVELSWDLEYISRYPMFRDQDGTLLTREDLQEMDLDIVN